MSSPLTYATSLSNKCFTYCLTHNFLSVQTNHDVTPDSVLLLHAAAEVVEEDGFDDLLDSVRDRVDEIESLHRTRELTVRVPSSSSAMFPELRVPSHRPPLIVLASSLRT